MESEAIGSALRSDPASLGSVCVPSSPSVLPSRFVTSEREHAALLRRIEALDVATLVARPSADAVDRLEIVAKAVFCTPPRLAVLLAGFPDVRAWVVR
jgi:hypothetical protein